MEIFVIGRGMTHANIINEKTTALYGMETGKLPEHGKEEDLVMNTFIQVEIDNGHTSAPFDFTTVVQQLDTQRNVDFDKLFMPYTIIFKIKEISTYYY